MDNNTVNADPSSPSPDAAETGAAPSRIADLGKHAGSSVTVSGWLYNKRGKGKLQFLILRDGTGVCQAVVFKPDVGEELFETARHLGYESSVRVTGLVKEDARAPGGYELAVNRVEVVAAADGEYPIPIQEDVPNIDKLLDVRHLWLRSRRPHAILRVRNEVLQAIRDFFYERDFVCCDTPVFTPAACEGTTTLFEVDYFDDKAYLTQSGQLYNEAAALAHGRVYCFGPTFRAEKSKTRRHLTEFWMVEPEMAYADLDDVMDLAEEFVAFIVARCLERARDHLEFLGRDLDALAKCAAPFPRLSYDEGCARIMEKARELADSDDPELRRVAGDCMTAPGGDFGAADETVLGMLFDRPVLVHRYPAAIKAFYMKRDPDDPSKALCVDLIGPEGAGELIGGGQREDSLQELEKRIAEHGLPRESFNWYLDLRRFGSVPHGGFGLGIERTVAWICGTPHVRECIPFPRMLHRVYP